MSKPVFMRLHQGGVEIAVNMSQVAYMAPNNPKDTGAKSVLYFAVWCRSSDGFSGEPLYIIIDEPIDEIANRREWHQ